MTSTTRPALAAGETLASYLDRVDAWKADGPWIPASGGTEAPVRTRSGVRLLYCYQPRSGAHAYLDLGTDMFLTDDEAHNLLST